MRATRLVTPPSSQARDFGQSSSVRQKYKYQYSGVRNKKTLTIPSNAVGKIFCRVRGARRIQCITYFITLDTVLGGTAMGAPLKHEH
jgi:hypothetical protein